MCVLLIDDSQDTTWVLSRLLTIKLGMEVRTVEDASQAVAAAAEFRPSAVCVDLSMPQLDGYDLAAAIRQIPGLERVAIIVISGSSPDTERASAAGIDAHLLKPVSYRSVAEAIATAILSRAAAHQNQC